MRDTLVKMKDGTVYCAPIWEWRPREGILILVGVDEELRLADMVSAVTKDQRTRIGVVEDRDELVRAREEGWDGT